MNCPVPSRRRIIRVRPLLPCAMTVTDPGIITALRELLALIDVPAEIGTR